MLRRLCRTGFPVAAVLAAVIRVISLAGYSWRNLATRWLHACVRLVSYPAKSFLTVVRMRRRHGQAAGQAGPQGGGAGRGAVPEPAPGAGDRCGVPGQRLLRRPGRGAGQVRDGAQGAGGRRPGHRGRRGVRVLPAGLLRRGRRAGVLRAGRAGARPARAARRPASSPRRSSPGPRSSWPPTPRCARRSCRTGSRTPSACACTPARSSERWPAAGSATPKAAELPARETRKEDDPSLSLLPSPGHAAAEPGARLDAGQDYRPRRRAGRPLRAAPPCRPARARRGVPARARRAGRQGRHRLAAHPGQPRPRRPAAGHQAGQQARRTPAWPPSSSAPWRPSRSPQPRGAPP